MTTADAAEILGVTRQRIHVMIQTGRLKATGGGRQGCEWIIEVSSVEKVKANRRGPGRPCKEYYREIDRQMGRQWL